MLYYAKKNDELYHHGILGQKWGVRRYQNPDGTLTAAGKKRASYRDIKEDQLQYVNSHKEALKESKAMAFTNNKVKKHAINGQRTADYLLQKYGEKRIARYDRQDSIRKGAMTAGLILAAPVYVPAAILTATVFGNKLKKENPDLYYSNPDVQRLEEQKRQRKKR